MDLYGLIWQLVRGRLVCVSAECGAATPLLCRMLLLLPQVVAGKNQAREKTGGV